MRRDSSSSFRGAGWLPLAPRSLPHPDLLRDDVGASFEELGKHFGVSPPTVRRWFSSGQVPRAVLLALFYESRWGRSFVASEVDNQARLLSTAVLLLRDQVESLHRQLSVLGRLGEFGSANDPSTDSRSSDRVRALSLAADLVASIDDRRRKLA